MGFSMATTGTGKLVPVPSPRDPPGKKIKETTTSGHPVMAAAQREDRVVGTQLQLCSRRAALLLAGISTSSLLRRAGEAAAAEELAVQGQSRLIQEQVSHLMADAGQEPSQPSLENSQRLRKRPGFRGSADRASSTTGRGRQRAREPVKLEGGQTKNNVDAPQPQQKLMETNPSSELLEMKSESNPSPEPLQQQQLEAGPSNELSETIPSPEPQQEPQEAKAKPAVEMPDTVPSSGGVPEVIIIKEASQRNNQANPLTALLNGVGILGSGLLGALYVITKKDKAAAESTARSMQSLLDEKETAKFSLEQSFEKSMLHEKEQHNKVVMKLKEGQADLMAQLTSANSTVGALGRELQSEKQTLKDLTKQLEQLQSHLTQAEKDKKQLDSKLRAKIGEISILEDKVGLLGLDIAEKQKTLEALKVEVSMKETECQSLNFDVEKTKADYVSTCSATEQLKSELAKTTEEVKAKNFLINEMNRKIDSLLVERDELHQKTSALREQYTALKASSAENEQSNSRRLTEKEDKIKEIEQKLTLSATEVQDKHTLASALTKERDDTRALLDEATKINKDLEGRLIDVQGSLEASKLDASELSDQLEVTQRKCVELELQLSMIQEESSRAKDDLINNIEEAKAALLVLSDEQVDVKKELNKVEQELAIKSEELKFALEVQESLRNEVSENNQKADYIECELKEEKTAVAALRKQLETSNDEIKQYAEAAQALEAELKKAAESLNEVNTKVASLSGEGETANSRVSTLETENEEMRNSLAEKKKAMKEAQESVEDAQDLITRLGAETEKLEQRNKQLEEELGTAKSQILRMRRQRNLRNASSGDPNGVDTATAPAVTKRSGRRRKAGPAMG